MSTGERLTKFNKYSMLREWSEPGSPLAIVAMFLEGETHDELAPHAEFTHYFDLSAMGGSKGLDQRQTEPAPSACAVAGFIHAKKPIENEREVLFGNPDAGIDD